jgi:nucleoid-associated protein YgaU
MLWVAGLAVLLAGCGKVRIAADERNERGSALYRKAFAAEQAGDLKEAVRLFNKVLVEEPRSFSAHFQLATLLQDHEEDYLGAIYHYKRYLALRPESEKGTLASERIRVAEQMLAPQLLKKVGDSVKGISQAHLLKESERLNRAITTLEGEKSVLLEEKTAAEKELAGLRGDNARLRDILRKMRVDESAAPDRAASAQSIGAAAREELGKTRGDESAAPSGAASARSIGAAARAELGADASAATDAAALRALREEAQALAQARGQPTAERRPVAEVPTTESVLKRVEEKLTGDAARAEAGTAKKTDKTQPSDLSALSLFGRGEKKEKKTAADYNPRTYVAQPGDTLSRVAEKFYGDSSQWKKIREANRTRIDPDGRIRAGQIIVVP